jgi:hypothetical protein
MSVAFEDPARAAGGPYTTRVDAAHHGMRVSWRWCERQSERRSQGCGRGPASAFIVRGAMAPVSCVDDIGRLLPAR